MVQRKGDHLTRAEVLAVLSKETIRLILAPGEGLADGGVHFDVSLELVPSPHRLPGTKLWVQIDSDSRVHSITPRSDSDE
jgi:hypothetical protein